MYNNLNGDQFGSYFKYSSVPSYDVDENSSNLFSSKNKSNNKSLSDILYIVILLVSCTVLIFTFPISCWFCVKRVGSLQRCIIHRLGKRLPLRGPGFMIVLPFIDMVNYIDLHPIEVNLVEKTNQLTSDGSIIELDNCIVEIVVVNALKSFMQLQDSKRNVTQFLKLSFSNMVGGTHVEDLEIKMDYIMAKFLDNCNSYTNNWGWQSRIKKNPDIKVITRSDPINPIVLALKNYFKPSGNDKESSPNITLSNVKETLNDPFIGPLQIVANKYAALNAFGVESLTICVSIKEDVNGIRIYKYTTETKSIRPHYLEENENVNIKLTALNMDDFMDFVETNDTSKVEIKTSF